MSFDNSTTSRSGRHNQTSAAFRIPAQRGCQALALMDKRRILRLSVTILLLIANASPGEDALRTTLEFLASLPTVIFLVWVLNASMRRSSLRARRLNRIGKNRSDSGKAAISVDLRRRSFRQHRRAPNAPGMPLHSRTASQAKALPDARSRESPAPRRSSVVARRLRTRASAPGRTSRPNALPAPAHFPPARTPRPPPPHACAHPAPARTASLRVP